MLSRIPRAQRRLVILTAVAAIAAGIFAAVAIVMATGEPAVRPGEYEPFVVGNAARLGEILATEQPLFFADPTGGTRGFVLALDDGDFVALHVIPPGGSRACPVGWDVEEGRFQDCRGKVYAAGELRRFSVTIDDDGLVVVDLRRLLDPRPG